MRTALGVCFGAAALLSFALCIPAVAAEAGKDKDKAIPKQKDAVDQLIHAMGTYYRPAARAKGAERKELCRKAVRAFEAVWTYFPKTKDRLSPMMARFYQGMCYNELGERKKAAQAFLAAYRQPYPTKVRDRHQGQIATFHRMAHDQLLRLADVLSVEEREEVNRER